MQYLIAHILSDPVASYHRQLTKDLSDRFGVSNVNESIPPHLTLKSPFSVESTDFVKEILTASAQEFAPASLSFSGFSHFDERVLYMDATASPKAREQIDTLTRRLQENEDISLSKHDDPITLHATVARAPDVDLFTKMKAYLDNHKDANFTSSFDSVSLLAKSNHRWKEVHKFSFI